MLNSININSQRSMKNEVIFCLQLYVLVFTYQSTLVAQSSFPILLVIMATLWLHGANRDLMLLKAKYEPAWHIYLRNEHFMAFPLVIEYSCLVNL